MSEGPINDTNGRTASNRIFSSVRKVMGSDDETNRDPKNLNPHLKVMWNDIVGEPEGLKSLDIFWTCSRITYNVSRTFCYILLVVLLGPLIALINGLLFAILSFCQIWLVGPCLRCCKINCGTLRMFTETLLQGPYFQKIFALIFSKFKVRHQKLPEADTDNAADYFNV
ncbi:caveolin-3-like [Hyalella azteca]|uniref:Caveolin n=1 Tax=Hyalella azteca TaxID=294128 RepID=A0A979FUX7_HYAAZ|nr:caveolin-3-like [Hyalella azteca]